MTSFLPFFGSVPLFLGTDFADAPGLGCIFGGLVLQGSLFTSDRGPYFEADLSDIPYSGFICKVLIIWGRHRKVPH